MQKKKKIAEKSAAKLETKAASKSTNKPAVKIEKGETKRQSRNQLMEAVKSRGIKNFRVMNKAELAEIIGCAKPDRIEAIMKEAVARWKSGWGTKKEE